MPYLELQQILPYNLNSLHLAERAPFRAGSLKYNETWEAILANEHPDKDLLVEILKDGIKAERFLTSSPPRTVKSNYRMTAEDRHFCTAEIKNYLDRSAIEETDLDTVRLCLPIFVDRSRTKPRLIWDGTVLNAYTATRPFSLEGMNLIAQLVTPDADQFVLDHRSGYHHIRIEARSRKYFAFSFEGQVYQFTDAMPFGWAAAPYIYQQFSGHMAAYIRQTFSIPVSTYIDDTWGQCWPLGTLQVRGMFTEATRWSEVPPEWRQALARLCVYIVLVVQQQGGYYTAADKGQMEPAPMVDILGLVVDTNLRIFRVPQTKLDDVKRRIQLLIHCGTPQARDLNTIILKLTAMAVAIPPLGRYRDALQSGWRAMVAGSSTSEDIDAMAEVLRTVSELCSEAQPRQWPKPGAVCLVTKSDGETDIYLTNGLGQQHERIRARSSSDVITAITTTSRNLDLLRDRRWHWAFPGITDQIPITHQRILTDMNVTITFTEMSDIEPRGVKPNARGAANAVLAEQTMLLVWQQFGPFTVDIFADSENAIRDPYTGERIAFVTQWPQGDTVSGQVGCDALAWAPADPQRERIYAFPPPKLVDHFIAHAARCRMKVTLVTEIHNFRTAIRYWAYENRTMLLHHDSLENRGRNGTRVPLAARSDIHAIYFDFTEYQE